MATLIKNQILKHLSKFAKNLSHDQIHLSTLKGEGELKNLVLNEEVLTELLELPSWLRLSRATCNRVAVRIQWTKLKSVPIHLSLDEVRVEVETCEDLRPVSASHKGMAASYVSGGHYGFSDKVVDGITLTVNSVLLTLKSHAFIASFQMSRIVVESKSPTWQKADLRMTRVKDTDRGELLIFKELSWQTVRIEAKSTMNEDLTPLRLITNQARCRITIKKKLSDCAVLGCRLVLILDDLLWVLTDDQLKAALHFADSLSGLLKRATEETQKVKGARKLESLSESHIQSKDKAAKKKTQSGCVAAKVFARYDVVETSYHFYSDRIDLHLCDDPGGKGRSCHPELSDGGAFQVSLSQLQMDFYPYHLACGDRAAWIRYQPEASVHTGWLENSLNAFQSTMLDSITANTSAAAAMASFTAGGNTGRHQHAPLSRANAQQQQQTSSPFGLPSLNNSSNSSNNKGDHVKEVLVTQFRKLMTTNLVVRLNNFAMWKVSTSKAKTPPKEFLSGDRERFSLPDDMPVMHFEYTQFYYPGDMDFPLPPPKLFAYFNPIQLTVDPLTTLWLNAFALNLQRSVKMLAIEQTDPPYLDVKLEAIMFRIIIEATEEIQHQRQRDRPRALHVQASRILGANYRSLETGSKADLAKCLECFQETQLFFGTDFPNTATDIPVVCDKLIQHATGADDRCTTSDVHLTSTANYQDLWPVMKKELLWTEAKDVWYLHLDPLWADFHGTPATGTRPVPFLDAFPVSLWLYKQEEDFGLPNNAPLFETVKPKEKKKKKEKPAIVTEADHAKMHLLVQITNLVSVQLNHYQFLFLMRLLETVSEITTFLAQDVRHILGEADESSMALGLIAPQVDLSLLMPSISQSRDNIGGDYDTESVYDNTLSSIYSVGDMQQKRSTPSPSVSVDETSSSRAETPQNNTLSATMDPQADETISAPVSPSRMNKKALPNADSVPNISRQPPATIQQQMPPPPAINLPPGNSIKTTKAQQQKKNSLTSSLTNMMAHLDSSFRSSGTAPGVLAAAAGAPTTPTSASDDDLLSVKSDDSDADSECFVVINQADSDSGRDSMDATLFAINSKRTSPVEMAAEVTEDLAFSSNNDLSSSSSNTPAAVAAPPAQQPPSQNNAENHKRDGVISVATFHLGRLELAQQSVGSHSCIKIQAASLSGEECPSISWEEFQSKFTVRGKGWCESTRQAAASWVFKMRFSMAAPDYQEMLKHATLEVATMSLKEKISRSAEAFVDLKVQNLPLQFYMSTLTGLTDLIEDEIIPTPIPMKIQLENLALHLVEDRPSANITSPGSLPIDVAIPALSITRDKSGLFAIQPSDVSNVSSALSNAHASVPEVVRPDSSSPSLSLCSFSSTATKMTHHLDLVRSGVASIETELQQRASLLAVDNANLRTLLEQTNSEVQTLRGRLQEFDLTQKKLVKMQQQMLAMDKENKSLKQTLKYLQAELVKTGKKNPTPPASSTPPALPP